MVLRRSSRSASAKPPSAAAKPPSKSVLNSRINGIKRPASVPPAPKQLKPYFNPLPVPPQRKRPGLLPFVWGTGNFGQFGMGPDVLGEVSKPKRNTWIEEHIEAGAFGEDNAGIESVACGGLHTIFLDERGTVSRSQRSP